MYDLVSIGSISVDLFFKGESLTYKDGRFQLAVGGKYLASDFFTSVGGGGANVAIGVRKHNLRTAVMGVIGNNAFKKVILDKLEENKVSYSLSDFEDGYFNISSIFLTEKGERSIVHYVTPHVHLLHEKGRLVGITKSKFIYLGNLPEVTLHEREIFLDFFKKRYITTAVNLGVSDCRKSKEQLQPFLDKVDILIVNGHEFAELVKASYKDIVFKENVVQWYIPYLYDQILVVTEGEKGSYAYWQGKVFHQKAIKIDKVIDATGAGDGYTAGFISEFFKTKDIEKSMLAGSRYAVKILGKIGSN